MFSRGEAAQSLHPSLKVTAEASSLFSHDKHAMPGPQLSDSHTFPVFPPTGAVEVKARVSALQHRAQAGRAPLPCGCARFVTPSLSGQVYAAACLRPLSVCLSGKASVELRCSSDTLHHCSGMCHILFTQLLHSCFEASRRAATGRPGECGNDLARQRQVTEFRRPAFALRL